MYSMLCRGKAVLCWGPGLRLLLGRPCCAGSRVVVGVRGGCGPLAAELPMPFDKNYWPFLKPFRYASSSILILGHAPSEGLRKPFGSPSDALPNALRNPFRCPSEALPKPLRCTSDALPMPFGMPQDAHQMHSRGMIMPNSGHFMGMKMHEDALQKDFGATLPPWGPSWGPPSGPKGIQDTKLDFWNFQAPFDRERRCLRRLFPQNRHSSYFKIKKII